MTNAAIAKTINKVSQQDKSYSLGFRRRTSVPQRVMNKLILATAVNGENNFEWINEKLENMTEQEFINWLKFM